jgi:malonate decarboxylase epsilon subunit
MSVAVIFPGQGSQSIGMLHQLLLNSYVAGPLDEVSEVLHSDVRDLDSESALQSTVSVQLALLAAGVAAVRAFMSQDICLRPHVAFL